MGTRFTCNALFGTAGEYDMEEKHCRLWFYVDEGARVGKKSKINISKLGEDR
jgi:hypothetical protein